MEMSAERSDIFLTLNILNISNGIFNQFILVKNRLFVEKSKQVVPDQTAPLGSSLIRNYFFAHA